MLKNYCGKSIGIYVVAILGVLTASWGFANDHLIGNPACCINGVCRANRIHFGHYMTKWRKWPMDVKRTPIDSAPGPLTDVDGMPSADIPSAIEETLIVPPKVGVQSVDADVENLPSDLPQNFGTRGQSDPMPDNRDDGLGVLEPEPEIDEFPLDDALELQPPPVEPEGFDEFPANPDDDLEPLLDELDDLGDASYQEPVRFGGGLHIGQQVSIRQPVRAEVPKIAAPDFQSEYREYIGQRATMERDSRVAVSSRTRIAPSTDSGRTGNRSANDQMVIRRSRISGPTNPLRRLKPLEPLQLVSNPVEPMQAEPATLIIRDVPASQIPVSRPWGNPLRQWSGSSRFDH